LRGIVDLSNSAIVEAHALVGSRSGVPFNRRSQLLLAGAALGSYQLWRYYGWSLTVILLCAAQYS
jgi:hypothetical protein